LNLAEKNYENLVEALINNAIDTASSNTTLSIPHSSLSMFPNLSNQIDTHKIEKSENYHNNNKGDIDD